MLDRQRQVADQRYDLPHYDRMLDAIEREFQTYNFHFLTSQNKIVKNFEIENAGGLIVRVNKSTDSFLFHTEQPGSENILLKTTLDDTISLTLADNATNYVELQIFKTTSAPEVVAIWDAVANSQLGEEFSQISDTCFKLDARLVSNTIYFSGDTDKIPMAIVTTSGGVIVSIDSTVRTDEFFWHLKEDWDFGVVRNDYSISTLKEAWDAITTSMKEMKKFGAASINWFDAQGVSTLDLLERSNYILTDGGDIDWEVAGVEALRWSAALKIVAPNRPFNYTIDPQTIASVADGEVVYVTFPDVGVAPSGSLAVNKTSDSSYLIDPDNTRNFIIAYRSGDKIYFGNGWQNVELESGEINQLGDGITKALLIAGGLTDENDSTPPYTSTFVVTPGTSWTNAISELDFAVNELLDAVFGTVYTEKYLVGVGGLPAGTQITLPNSGEYGFGLNALEIYYDGSYMFLGDDYIEIDDGGGIGTKIELLYDLPEGVKIVFRIPIGGVPPASAAGDIIVQDEGSQVEGVLSIINFTGLGVTATQVASGIVEVNIPGTGGGPTALPPTINRLNSSGVSIPNARLVYLKDDDTIEMTDADEVSKGTAIGITTSIITDANYGDIYTLGWVIPGILGGLGILPGKQVFMSESTGEMVGEGSPNFPLDAGDVLFKVGVATNLVSGEAKDLIMQIGGKHVVAGGTSGSSLLLEDGTKLLLENGDFLIL